VTERCYRGPFLDLCPGRVYNAFTLQTLAYVKSPQIRESHAVQWMIDCDTEMSVTQVTLEYPEGLETAVQTTPEELGAQIRLMAALKMFELGKLSLGMAAELAGMSRVEFLEQCGRYRVSVFNYRSEELDAELQSDLEAMRETAPPFAQEEPSEDAE
jgi:predicted HTH domain antitoxin